jgi:hypothetical protein
MGLSSFLPAQGTPMNHLPGIVACTLALPGVALAATRTYEVSAFEAISVAAGIDADITIGPSRRVVAETKARDFDDLRISVEDNVLKIGRPARSWFFFGRANYKVHVVTPALRSLAASSGADVNVTGPVAGDFSVSASSGSDVDISGIKGGNVKAHASSGSDVDIAGSCVTLKVDASSGSDLDAGNLRCETITVQISSGSDVSVSASKRVTGKASSGSEVRVSGAPPDVQVDKSSGADVIVRH